MKSQAIYLDENYIDFLRETNKVTDDKPIRAVIYARVSTEMQPQSALGSQEETAREFANLNGIEVVEVFSDKGISGTTDKRPNFQQMIKYVEEKDNGIHMIIVYKLDRFFRNEQLHHVYEYNLGKHGVFVLSATEEIYRMDMGTRMFKAFTLINNENESVKIRQNVKRGQRHAAKQGKTNGGIAPLGYDINSEGRYVINKDEAKIVKKIFEMRHQGMTYTEMAEKMNEKHYKTKVGRKFTKNSFYEILRNPKYKGIFTYNTSSSVSEYGKRPNRHKYKDKSEIIELDGKIEAIVSEKLWDSVQPKKNVNSKKGRGKYLLSGMVKCPVCNNTYQIDTKKDVQYLRHNKGKTDKCRHYIRMDEVEKQVLQKTANKVFSKANLLHFTENFDEISKEQSEKTHKKIQTLKCKISSLKTKYNNLVDSLSEATDKRAKDSITNKMKNISAEMDTYTNDINNLKKAIPQKPTQEQLREAKKRLVCYLENPKNMIEAKKLLHALIDVVYISDKGVKVKFKL